MKQIWITRSEPGASKTAERLRERGYEPLVAPLLTIEPAPKLNRDPSQYQAVLFTSANGVRAFAALSDARLRALCVGDATAEAAREAGFADVESAAGDADDLLALSQRTLDPAGGPVLFASGEHIAAKIHQSLGKAGYSVDRSIVYRAAAADSIPKAAQEAIEAGGIDVVLFHSARAAEAFTLVVPARIARLFRYATISRNAAGPLFIPYETAAKPDEESLLATLDRICRRAR